MTEKKMKIRGFENMTIEEYMEQVAQKKVDAQFPGKEGRPRIQQSVLHIGQLLIIRQNTVFEILQGTFVLFVLIKSNE